MYFEKWKTKKDEYCILGEQFSFGTARLTQRVLHKDLLVYKVKPIQENYICAHDCINDINVENSLSNVYTDIVLLNMKL